MGKLASKSGGRWREILGFTLLALTALLFLALATDGYLGQSQRPLNNQMGEVPNALGVAGAVTAGVLSLLVGPAAHVLYFITCVWAIMLIRHRPLDWFPLRLLGALLLTGSIAGILHVDMGLYAKNPAPGGAIGAFVGEHLALVFGVVGSNIIAGLLAIIGVLLSTEFLFLRLFVALRSVARVMGRGIGWMYRSCRETFVEFIETSRGRRWPFRRAESPAASAPRKKASTPVPEAPAREAAPVSEPQTSESSDPLLRELEILKRIRVKTGPPLPLFDEEGEEDWTGIAAPHEADAPVIEAAAADETDAAPADADADIAQPEMADDETEESAPEFAAAIAPLTPFSVLVNADEIDEDMTPAVDEGIPVAAAPVAEEREAAPIKGVLPLQLALPSVDLPRERNKRPRLRCKTAPKDELPPDYEYPKHYTKPPLTLFDRARIRIGGDMEEQLRQTGLQLEETLRTFGIEATVTDVVRGPTITRFELQPAPGVKVSRFHSLADDIALALKAQGVRVEAPIPGKGRVGIEIPNKKREPVVVRELFESDVFQRGDERLRLALGKDIAGDVMKADLTAMPHLLVAGATGAGKTVCIKTFLASLLVTATPEEIQLILIDPKMVELSIFNDIPHLITPVVTDPKKASTALNWLINEMEERYRLFAHLRVRNIEVYNERVENGEIEMLEPGGENTGTITVNRKLPYIVCIIDELADLMMLARAEVEDAIARLAQLARATGIHLIIATQRPSVDVLTGVIKANFPARMSFQVSSRVDSRCILDEIGAERLIGKGDMLYLPPGRSKPIRIQGAFVSDQEMEALIAHLKMQAPPQYRDEIEQFGQTQEAKEELLAECDELFDDAVRVVLDTGQASISMVQRRLRVGYTRAARLIDMMELRGIVGPHTGSKAREILVSGIRKTDEVA